MEKEKKGDWVETETLFFTYVVAIAAHLYKEEEKASRKSVCDEENEERSIIMTS